MQLRIRSLSFAVAMGLATLVGGSSAKADFLQIFVIQDDAVVFNAIDNVFGDLDAREGFITVDADALNTALVGAGNEYLANSLAATSNQTLEPAFSNEAAVLRQEGSFSRLGTTGNSTLTIVTTDTGFTFPVGSPKILGTSASDSFTNVEPGPVRRTFQSFLDPDNTQLSDADPTPIGTSGQLLQLTSSGTPNGSDNDDAVPTLVFTDTDEFALTNVSIINLPARAGTLGAAPTDQFTGTTTVIVPEPATMTLLTLGIPVLGFVYGRRKKARA